MKIVIACGASGGHIFPGIALAQELLDDKGNEVLIVSSDKPLDIEILKKSGCSFETMPRNPFIFTPNPLRLLAFFVRLIKGVFSGVRLLLRHRPDCVVGFGGFASGPVIFAAWCLRIPRIIHEQNFIAGLANRIGSVFASRVAVSFEDTKRFFKRDKVITVGNPVRKSFINLDKTRSRERFGLEPARFTIFIIGGSQGANAVNNAVVDMLGLMDHEQKKRLQVIHATGKDDYEPVKRSYSKEKVKSKVFSFLDEIDRAYTAADLVIARAGATTIAELTYFGKPSILVPYGKKNVHQTENAYFLSGNKAAVTVEEKDLSAEGIKGLILGFLEDPGKLDEISRNSKRLGSPNASRMLAEEVKVLSGGQFDHSEKKFGGDRLTKIKDFRKSRSH